LVGVFFAIMMNMNKIANDIENDVEIRVHIDLAAKEEDQQQLKANIEKLQKVESVTFSSKEQELENLIADYGKELSLFKQDNPLFDVFIVKAANPTDTPVVAEQIKKFDYASEVIYGEEKVKKLFNFLKISRNVGLVLIVGL